MGEVNETGGSREAIEAIEAIEAVETFDAFEAADAVHFSHLQVQELPTNPVGACRRSERRRRQSTDRTCSRAACSPPEPSFAAAAREDGVNARNICTRAMSTPLRQACLNCGPEGSGARSAPMTIIEVRLPS